MNAKKFVRFFVKPAFIIVGLIFLTPFNVAFADARSDVDKYTQEINANPNNAVAYAGRANAYVILQNYDRAISDTNKALEIDPNYAAAYGVRGMCNFFLGQYERSVSDLSKAVQLDPDSKNNDIFYEARGEAYMRLRKNNEAIADFTKSISINPSNAKLYALRGGLYLLMENYNVALDDMNKALTLNPPEQDRKKIYLLRGMIYRKLGETEKADADFARAK